MNARWWKIVVVFGCAVLCASIIVVPSFAQAVKKRASGLDDVAFSKAITQAPTQVQLLDEARAVAGSLPAAEAYDKFLYDNGGGQWTLLFDRVTGEPALIEGEGIPWIPGTGWRNSVTGRDLGLPAGIRGRDVPLAVVATKAREFIKANPGLFGTKVDELTLNQAASGPVADYLYFLEFDVVHQGVPVENARVVFRINHGNLIQFGQEYISPALQNISAAPAITLDTAWEIVKSFVADIPSQSADTVVEPGRLLIIPVGTPQALSGAQVEPGTGLDYRLVWILSFRRDGVPGTWEARVDAQSGEMLSFRDSNEYGSIHGGVYTQDRPVPESDKPMPYANYSGTTTYADAAGAFPGTSGTTTLNGKYVTIADSCGSISASTTTGDLNLGMSTGIDCATPGTGGAGNTHAARTQYYNVTLLKMKALNYLPSNTWLQGKVTDNVNGTTTTCNAYWNGSSLNFFRSGGGCWNTGELPGVSLHEFGHGLDANDGDGSSPDNGTGETYGDTTALLQTHLSCLGNGFMGVNCTGYGDTCVACTGVRDLDYGKHVRNLPAISTMLNATTGFHCQTSTSYRGPCGYEGHCESAISSQAIYDLAARDLVTWGMDAATAWQTVDRLWYLSRSTATAAYGCNTSTLVTTGCNAGNLYIVFRAVDDADGNLANGTPHASAIYAAFNRHNIACSTTVNTDDGSCGTIPAPILNATAANGQVLVNWSASVGAASYNVLRNEVGCDAGYTKVANVAVTTYTDSTVVNGVNYSYRIQPVGSNASCFGALSNCSQATPLSCTPPNAPSGLSATPNGNYRIDLSWNAVSGTISYNIYRRTATSGYSLLTEVSSALTAYSDVAVSGGVTYYYVIRSFSTCESVNSAEASATAAGTCNLSPTFSGIASAMNALASNCGNVLTWAAGTSNCGGTLTYGVYRSTVSGFNPSPANSIVQGLSGLTYTDTGVIFGTTYYYAVRAFDSISGIGDANAVTLGASPTGPATTIYQQTFESSSDWVATKGTPAATTGDFIRGQPNATVGNLGEPCQPGSGHNSPNCLYTAANPDPSQAGVDDVDGGEVIATSPAFNGTGFPNVRLDMWRWFVNEYTDDAGDYYKLEASNDGGSTWTLIDEIPDSVSIKNGAAINQWNNSVINLEGFLALTSNMKVRVRVADGTATGGLIECALDDIYVKGYPACTGCTPTAAPGAPSLTAPSANKVDLSWSAVSGAATYAVFRTFGSCPGTGLVLIAGNIAGTNYSDTSVSGGQTYSYYLKAYTSNYCESSFSPCAQIATTGLCTQPPDFAGVTSVSSAFASTCGIALSWTAATPRCGTSVTYNVYRSSSASFLPGPKTLIAKCVSGTSYTDSAGLAYGVSYYYVVRAEDNSGTGSGPCGGNEDANLVIKSSGPSGAYQTGGQIFFDNFESGTGTRGWDTGYFVGNANDWRGVMACTPNQSSSHIFRWGGSTCVGNYQASVASLASPRPNIYGLDIPFDATNVQLTFYQRGNFAAGDGALLLMQKQPTATYYFIPSSAISGRTYNGITGTNNVLGANYPCWNGNFNSQMYSTTVNLDAACSNVDGKPCAGSTLAIAFTGSSDATTQAAGWFLDDVQVTANYGATSCATSGCAMVADVTPNSASAAVGQDVLLSIQHTAGVSPYHYQWTEDGVDIAGAVGAYLPVNKALAGSHTYNCKVTDSSGLCANVTDAQATTVTWSAAAPTPLPVPYSVTPTKITKDASSNLTWDATDCASTNYHVIYGWGSTMGSSPVVVGGQCALGTTGTATWTPPDPSNDSSHYLWFFVVGDDGATTEGPWGLTTEGTTPSGVCGMTTKNNTGTCGTP